MVKNIAIVSLSSGVLGEGFVAHEVEIGLKRLRNYGLNVRFMPHALKGLAYVKNHPEDRAADLLAAEGIRATVVNMHTVKPLDEDAVLSVAEKCGAVVTAEEHSVIGGLGSAVAEVLAGRSGAKFARVGIEDRFGQSGTPAELFADYGLTAENIAENARRLVK